MITTVLLQRLREERCCRTERRKISNSSFVKMGPASCLNKKFFTSSFIFFLYILTCQSAFVGRRNQSNYSDLTVGSNGTVDPNSNYSINYREARRSVASGGLFSIVSFDNVPCSATNGDIGICYTARECDNLGGTQSGVCAGNYGVCCVIYLTCDATISINNTYFVNPGYPSSSTDPLSCCVSIAKITGASQLYLEFDDFQLLGPTAGLCTNDTFTIKVGGATTPITYPTLCGNNVGQTEYVDLTNAAGPTQLCINLGGTLGRSSFGRTWKIRLVEFKSTDSCASPSGCNQYFQTSSGVIQSYNFQSGQGELISGYCTTMCFALNAGNCNLMLTENTFMLPGTAPHDCIGTYLLANGQQFCGDTLSNGILVVNKTTTSYIPITFCTGSNADMDVGFNLNYTQLPCVLSG